MTQDVPGIMTKKGWEYPCLAVPCTSHRRDRTQLPAYRNLTLFWMLTLSKLTS